MFGVKLVEALANLNAHTRLSDGRRLTSAVPPFESVAARALPPIRLDYQFTMSIPLEAGW